MRAILTTLAMTTVAPVTAVTTLLCWNPERWGGSIDLLNILVMSLFGVITIPLWPTYVPAIALTPLVMGKISTWHVFRRLPLVVILCIFFVMGAFAGLGVISIIVPWDDSLDLILNWVSAGVVSGAVTAVLISLIYRWTPTSAKAHAVPNGVGATPPPIPSIAEGLPR